MKDEIAKLREEIHRSRQTAEHRHREIDRLNSDIDRLRTKFARSYFIMATAVAVAIVFGWGWFTSHDRLVSSRQIVDVQATAISTMSRQFDDLQALYRIEQARAGKFEEMSKRLERQRNQANGRLGAMTRKQNAMEKTLDMITNGRWSGNAELKPKKED